jgi:hypothetical protein
MERPIFSTGSAYRALKDINCGSSNFLAGEHLIFLRDGYSPYDESFVYEFRDDAGKTKSWLMPEGASENDWKSCFIPA